MPRTQKHKRLHARTFKCKGVNPSRTFKCKGGLQSRTFKYKGGNPALVKALQENPALVKALQENPALVKSIKENPSKVLQNNPALAKEVKTLLKNTNVSKHLNTFGIKKSLYTVFLLYVVMRIYKIRKKMAHRNKPYAPPTPAAPPPTPAALSPSRALDIKVPVTELDSATRFTGIDSFTINEICAVKRSNGDFKYGRVDSVSVSNDTVDIVVDEEGNFKQMGQSIYTNRNYLRKLQTNTRPRSYRRSRSSRSIACAAAPAKEVAKIKKEQYEMTYVSDKKNSWSFA